MSAKLGASGRHCLDQACGLCYLEFLLQVFHDTKLKGIYRARNEPEKDKNRKSLEDSEDGKIPIDSLMI